MSSPRPPFPLLPVLAVIGAMASLAVGTSMAKSLFPALGAAGTTLLRVSVATLILLAFWRPWRLGRLSRRDVGVLLCYGISLGTMNLLFYQAVDRIPFGVAVAFEFAGPLVVAVLTSRRAADFAWVGLAGVGLTLLLPVRTGDVGRLDPVGVAFALGAGACWALYIVFGQWAGRRLHGGQATSLGMAIAAVVVAPFGIARAGAAMLSPSLMLTGVGVGLMSGVLPYSLEMYALARLPRRTFSVLLSLEPALAALAGLLMLGERLSAGQTLAVGCVVVASIGSASNARRDPPPPTVD